MQVHSVMFFVVRTVREFDYRFVTNDTPNKWQPLERKSCCGRGSDFDRNCFFFPDRFRER
jgi:hypothetical protein